ncbi:hypothetical protein G0U57_003101, partial [Chelydra serpentina]
MGQRVLNINSGWMTFDMIVCMPTYSKKNLPTLLQGSLSREYSQTRGELFTPARSGRTHPSSVPREKVYLIYFLISKKKGGWRPILNLCHINCFIRKLRFHMVTLAAIIPSLEKGMWFRALNMKDAYFHVDIHPAHRCFLRFMVGSHHFQYKVFPFRIVTTPKSLYQDILGTGSPCQMMCLIVFPYFNDWLPVAKSDQEAYVSTSMMLHLLSSLGVIINAEKYVLTSRQSLDFTRATLNSITTSVPAQEQVPDHEQYHSSRHKQPSGISQDMSFSLKSYVLVHRHHPILKTPPSLPSNL